MSKHIVVIGNNLTAVMAANKLANQFRQSNLKLTFLNTKSTRIKKTITALPPSFTHLLNELKINKRTFMFRCHANYHLSTKYANWSVNKNFQQFHLSYEHELDEYYSSAFINNINLRKRGYNICAHPDSFMFNTTLASKGLSPDAPAHFPFAGQYGYTACIHNTNELLLEHFQKKFVSQSNNVRYTLSEICQVNIDKNNHMVNLTLDNGEELSADIYIDCTDKDSILNINTQYKPVEISHTSQCLQKQWTVKTSNTPPMTYKAFDQGWYTAIFYGDKMSANIVYNDELSNTQAEVLLTHFVDEIIIQNNLDISGIKLVEEATPSIDTYFCQKSWQHNVIKLGNAYCQLEPITSAELDISLFSLSGLAHLLSNPANYSGEKTTRSSEYFNDMLAGYLGSSLDFQLALFGFAKRAGTPFKLDFSTTPPHSIGVQQIAKAWANGSAISKKELPPAGAFTAVAWNTLLSGLGIYPNNGTLIDTDELKQFSLQELQTFYQTSASNYVVNNVTCEEQLSIPSSTLSKSEYDN